MKKHILSYYAKKDAGYQCSISSKNKKETRTVEQTDNDIMLSKKKGTIKTFSVENSDSDEAFVLKYNDKLKDEIETIKTVDIYFDKGTILTKSIEVSDSDNIIILKKTKLTENIENSDSDEINFIVNNKRTLLTSNIEQSDPDNTL